MRILLATKWGIPDVGGVSTLMFQMQKELELTGHNVDIMGQTPDNSAHHFVNHNEALFNGELAPLLFAKSKALFAGIHEPWILSAEVNRYCMELAVAYFGMDKYDIIHAQDAIAALAISRVKPSHIPLLASVHGTLTKEVYLQVKSGNMLLKEEEFNKSQIGKYYTILERNGILSADKVITSNQWMKSILTREHGISQEKIIISHNGLDIASFLQKADIYDSVLTLPPGKKIILCTSRLTLIKGIHYLLPALALLKQERDDWVCWIAGDGDMKEELLRQSAALGIGQHIVFLGHRHDVPYLLKQADIFVMPSIQDNHPFSVIEAQVAGKAVVVSDSGGLPEMVKHGQTGLVFPTGQSSILFNHLKLLLENDSYRRNLGQNAQKRSMVHWSIRSAMKRMVSIYESLVKKEGHA